MRENKHIVLEREREIRIEAGEKTTGNMVGEEETKLSEQLGAAKGALDAWARRQAEEVENECAAHRSSIAARRKEADALREEASSLRDEAKVVGKGRSPFSWLPLVTWSRGVCVCVFVCMCVREMSMATYTDTERVCLSLSPRSPRRAYVSTLSPPCRSKFVFTQSTDT